MIWFVLLVVIALIVILAICWVASYNKFVRQRHTIEESWRQVDVELQRRHVLIPNLIETVKAAAAFEQATLQQVMNARNAAMQARQTSHIGATQQGQIEGQLSGALHGFFALAENYPQLRASGNFVQLQQQLAETEDRIAAGRRFYNGNVRDYNARLQSVPSNIVGGMASYKPSEYFEIDGPQVRNVPQVQGAFQSLQQPQAPGNYGGYQQQGQYQQPPYQQPGQQPPYQQPGGPMRGQ